jgi:hypothetical protein
MSHHSATTSLFLIVGFPHPPNTTRLDESISQSPQENKHSINSTRLESPHITHYYDIRNADMPNSAAAFDTSDVIIVIVTFFTIVLAAPAGVGGGGILVPMYLAVGHFSPHYGIPLSKATILGGAITNNYFNLQRRHPVANRPLVDYTTSMILEPVLLLGTIIGVFFNAVSPGWAITVLLVITLCFTTWRTGMKAYETYLKEEKDQAEDENKRLIPSSSKDKEKHFSHGDPQDMSPEMAAIVKSESEHNLYAVGILCVAWVVIATFSLLKGKLREQALLPLISSATWQLSYHMSSAGRRRRG